MALSHLSDSTQNYLKIIWSLSEYSGEPATATLIAQRTGNRLSSVSDAVKRLHAAGLVSHRPYRPIELTEAGRTYALEMVRRHRLIETFLVEVLGYTWDQVHDEAEELEHAVSAFMVERIDALLGHPKRDPHGDPIPAANGTVATGSTLRLSDVVRETALSPEESIAVQVERISDSSADLLRTFSQLGLTPGTVLEVAAGSSALQKTGEQLILGEDDAAAVFVHKI